MVKTADLGMARIVPSLQVSTMTKAPGASIYMPPEALEDESRYDITIDIFSLGVLAIFTLTQMFPKPLTAAYADVNRKMVGRMASCTFTKEIINKECTNISSQICSSMSRASDSSPSDGKKA